MNFKDVNSKQLIINKKQAKQIEDLKLIIGEKDIYINKLI